MLDVVVEFSSIIIDNSLAFYKQPSTYEGRPIPGSPFEVRVAPNSRHAAPQRTCTGAELGNAPGSWVLADVPKDREHSNPVNFTTASFTWAPDTCRLPDLKCMVAASTRAISTCLPADHAVIIYAIGDSVTRVQAQSLADILGERIEGEGETYTQRTQRTMFHVLFQATNNGMMSRMSDIKQSIDRLLQCQHKGACTPVIHFNSGLHDLDKYCGNVGHQIAFRQDAGLGADFDCITSYVSLLQEVIQYVAASGFQGVKVFRTTTAAWLKFGNSQVDWFHPDYRDEQVFISNWLSVVRFNELAVPLFKKAGWHIIDGFQSSIGRPDHAEKKQGGAMVHFDHEVPDAHNQQLLSIVLEELCPHVLASCSDASSLHEGASLQLSRGRSHRGSHEV